MGVQSVWLPPPLNRINYPHIRTIPQYCPGSVREWLRGQSPWRNFCGYLPIKKKKKQWQPEKTLTTRNFTNRFNVFKWWQGRAHTKKKRKKWMYIWQPAAFGPCYQGWRLLSGRGRHTPVVDDKLLSWSQSDRGHDFALEQPNKTQQGRSRLSPPKTWAGLVAEPQFKEISLSNSLQRSTVAKCPQKGQDVC